MIDKNLICVDVDMPLKKDVFAYLAGLVVENGYADDTDQVYKSLLSREEEGTTGMMDGFAIPHAKSQAVIKPGIAVLKLKNGVEWESMDGKLIDSVIALFIPETEVGSTHLTYLSKIARILMKNDFKYDFQKAHEIDEIEIVFNKFLEV
ncbi:MULTISPECIES: fructose PTS transporter subunit IIA [Streptococcus]|uniref:Phosphoenolpyruvate-dependent sugar PTS family porter, EIIA 2 n=2 Tax=Streptococcus parauberis TaxID=1348 RepID=F1YZA2_9STRE|nr:MULTISPECIES: fructose PTS transporter subunit IIA [Streptococcus]QQB44144.1 PTS sugar transporter subunit IIA [Lactococcus garvieae]EGE54482.1 phosphoenolpyruvate-dependent sugar PTS family porter, EIIA 2 [Streptococcus parauberis NCFD 2020]EMF49722.1 PTS system, fructose-specific IIABC component [Streptococcus parauberis KRS-02109]MDT2732651.1 fructose PTS transporter subunit IIA [Streptococcus parauberis]ONH63226.1 PTS system fructose-specific EIIABC component [Streptococcus parauberis]